MVQQLAGCERHCLMMCACTAPLATTTHVYLADAMLASALLSPVDHQHTHTHSSNAAQVLLIWCNYASGRVTDCLSLVCCAAAAAVGAAAAAAAADDVDAAGVTDDDLAELANDPELDAYLEVSGSVLQHHCSLQRDCWQGRAMCSSIGRA